MSLEVHIEKKLNGFTLCSDFAAGNTATAIPVSYTHLTLPTTPYV